MLAGRFGLAPVRGVHHLRVGSTRSAKCILRCGRGDVVAKRRQILDDRHLDRLVAVHRLQTRLAERHLPVPRLIETVRGGRTLLRWRDRVYEIASFLAGSRSDRSAEGCLAAGRMLARFHAAAADIDPTGLPRLDRGDTWPRHEADVEDHDDDEDDLHALRELGQAAARRIDESGWTEWPRAVVHGDWHPGNLRFADGRLVAVLDLDAALVAPPVLDVAYGSLFFSLRHADPVRGDGSHAGGLRTDRWRAFCSGYEERNGQPLLSRAEIAVLPWLMVSTLVGEVLRTGPEEPQASLGEIRRHAAWIRDHADDLVRWLEG